MCYFRKCSKDRKSASEQKHLLSRTEILHILLQNRFLRRTLFIMKVSVLSMNLWNRKK